MYFFSDRALVDFFLSTFCSSMFALTASPLCVSPVQGRPAPRLLLNVRMASDATDDEHLMDSLRERIRVAAGSSDEISSLPPSGQAGASAASLRVRVGSIRPDGLEGAGERYADASLATTTGPVFNADDLPAGELTPARAIRGLYAAFNARDAACVGSFLTDDCVYEDLLLGPATVCRGKEAFIGARLPAPVRRTLLKTLPRHVAGVAAAAARRADGGRGGGARRAS